MKQLQKRVCSCFFFCIPFAYPLRAPGLILYTKPPFFIGNVVLKFDYNTERVYAVCPGYDIAIVYSGSLLEEREPTLKQFLQTIYDGMADFYLQKKNKEK